MHPKTEIRSDAAAIARILQAGWVGQQKIHGHRAQIHIPAETDRELIAYTRQGKQHTRALPAPLIKELRRLFTPSKGWNTIDAEWVKAIDYLYVFDLLKQEDEVLRGLTFPERWGRLPRAFLSPCIRVLPLLRDLPSCLKALNEEGAVEGLVFKSSTSTGFADTSIVRCRRKK
jgi:ATP-dependent DNA ligase